MSVTSLLGQSRLINKEKKNEINQNTVVLKTTTQDNNVAEHICKKILKLCTIHINQYFSATLFCIYISENLPTK